MIRTLEVFKVSVDEKIVFAGCSDGSVLILSAESLEIVTSAKVHDGSIWGLAISPCGRFVATIAKDARAVLSTWNGEKLVPRASYNRRSAAPWNDLTPVEEGDSITHAIAFHPSKNRLVTHAADGGLVELDFDPEDWRINVRHCSRFNERHDLNSVIYYGDDVLSGYIDGSVIRSSGPVEVFRWQIAYRTAHDICEGRKPGSFYVASDHGVIGEFDADVPHSERWGAIFTRDDLESLDYPGGDSVYAASFDRNLYKIDADSLNVVEVAFAAPFKLRWNYTFRKQSEFALVCVRDGRLMRILLPSQSIVAEYSEATECEWTISSASDGRIFVGGEFSGLRVYSLTGTRDFDSAPQMTMHHWRVDMTPSYTKRIAVHPSGDIFFARTDGYVYALAEGSSSSRIIRRYSSAVRDIAVDPSSTSVFVCTEAGEIEVIDSTDGTIVAQQVTNIKDGRQMPAWALAFNPWHNVLAVGEHGGNVFLHDGKTLARVATGPTTLRCKRMRFISEFELIMSASTRLELVNWSTARHRVLGSVMDNTVEDFIYDARTGYAVLISYTNELALIDVANARTVCIVPNENFVCKGLCWIRSVSTIDSNLDFMVIGRTGRPALYRIFNERIYKLGYVDEREIRPVLRCSIEASQSVVASA